MRIVIDSMIVLMLVGVAVGLIALRNGRQQDEQGVAGVQEALARLGEQAAYHTAVQSAMQDQDVMLVHLHPGWFGQDLPTNTLLGAEHPWIDLAPPGDLGLHPPDPVATDSGQAGFWYNPTTGVFRARVEPRTSEAQTLALYNAVNGTALDAFEQIPDPTRKPLAHVPGTTPSTRYASMANETWNKPKAKPQEQTQRLFEGIVGVVEQQKQDQAQEREQARLSAEAQGIEARDDAEPMAGLETDGPGPRPTLSK